MSAVAAAWILIVVAFVAANLPWLSEREFFVLTPRSGAKRAWVRLLEWQLLYFITGLAAIGLEKKLNGDIYPQGWEFYAVTYCLFLVFALPGFIYRYEFKRLLERY